MLRFSTGQVKALTNRSRNEGFPAISLSILRHRFCSQVSDTANIESSNPADTPNTQHTEDLQSLLNKNQSRKLVQATQVMAQIADLKRANKISDKDYENDTRYNKIIKIFESDIVKNSEPLVIVKGLKVGNIKTLINFYIL